MTNLAAAEARDLVVRATGTHEPSWLRLVDAALAEWPNAQRLPFTTETSVRLLPGAIERRRYTIGMPSHALGARPLDRVARIVAALSPPPSVERFIDRLRRADHLPSAILIGLAADEALATPTARIYFEQRALHQVLELPFETASVSAVSAEWPLGSNDVVLRRYRELSPTEGLAHAAAPTIGALPEPLRQPITELLSALDAQFYYVRSDAEPTATRAFQVIAAATPLARHVEAVGRIGDALGIARGELEQALTAVSHARLRVVSAGITRGSVPHVTLYNVSGEASVDEPRSASDVRETAGAVLLRVARDDGRLCEIVLTTAPGTSEPPRRVGNVGVFQVGRETDLACVVADVLALPTKLPPAATAALRIAVSGNRLREALAALGHRLLGYSVNP